jgi:hypothetical protein
MIGEVLRALYTECFQAIGGDENRDIRSVQSERPSEVTRASFFSEACWAVLVSGVSRKSTRAFWERASDSGFSCDFQIIASMTEEAWTQFLGSLYPDGVSPRGRKKWNAIRRISGVLAGFDDEDAFRAEFFGGKTSSADLDTNDGRRLERMGLPFIKSANAQYIVRNMGGEAVKCDRWLGALVTYLGISFAELERELVSARISLALFDVVFWAYCESYVRRVTELGPRLNHLLVRDA